MRMDDRAIVNLYWAREERAIAETQRKYGGFCGRLAKNILTVQEDAEECVNDTYLGAWNAMPPQRPLALFAFLARICRNIACDKLDKLRAHGGAFGVHRRPNSSKGSGKPRDCRSLKQLSLDAPRRCPALFHAPLLVYGFRKSHRRKVRLRRKPRQNVPPPHA